jgi:hypothetical protein
MVREYSSWISTAGLGMSQNGGVKQSLTDTEQKAVKQMEQPEMFIEALAEYRAKIHAVNAIRTNQICEPSHH